MGITMTRTVAEHLVAVLSAIQPLAPRELDLTDAGGRVLAADVTSTTPIPLFDNSAMDGYAVRSADLAGASAAHPITVPVAADIPAGAVRTDPVAPGTVARIMTGAPMPAGADAIVPVEYSDGGTTETRLTLAPEPGRHLRRAGEDLAAGDLVLPAGTVLHARQIAAAAAAGHGALTVHPRPRVAVISTGSELVTPGSTPRGGQIPDSNSYLLARLVAEAGAEPVRIGAVPDDEAEFARVLAEVSPRVDAIICSGGVSVGAYDVVKAVLAREPGMWFGTVSMQPGKPQGFGHLADGTTVFTLPGNPVSVYVSFAVFVAPALHRLAGHPVTAALPLVPARATSGWRSPAGREQFMPVRIAHDGDAPDGQPAYLVRPSSERGSGSHLVGTLAAADGLVRVPADVTEVNAGETVELLAEGRNR
ncbi:molybdopterin molybdotransferase MoeA [Ruania halotolerans]|uniref:molybdopterin molybdotransferase MoeA n=1 Tax=Ruania halotolerans TaxID=2897773 RepID=UPI001E28AD26|nr:gephyrin-like molybdotransferase Glp [Ruania halotolerans]UFU07235.1 molybdopterin molybdotransferase MoeA [Ruania halotolerans]